MRIEKLKKGIHMSIGLLMIAAGVVPAPIYIIVLAVVLVRHPKTLLNFFFLNVGKREILLFVPGLLIVLLVLLGDHIAANDGG